MKLTTLIISLCLVALISSGQDGWTNQTPSSTYAGLLGIDAIDTEHVWAVGTDGLVIHSIDGGDNWEIVNTGFDDDFTTVIFFNRDTGFISGDDKQYASTPFILRTFDGGLNWQRLELPSGIATSVNDINIIHSESEDSIFMYVVGGLGAAWKSKTLGDDWTILAGGCRNGNFNACCFIDKNTGWLVGTPDASSNNSIMITTDAGDSFIEQMNPEKRKLTDVSFIDAQKGVAVGLSYTILYTADGGENWETRTNTGYRWQGVYLSETGKTWAVGDKGRVGYSDDFGYTWDAQTSGESCELWDLDFINDSEGWIVGGGIGYPGIVLHTTTAGEPATAHKVLAGVSAHSLGQNYPNPFRNKTKINYQIKNPGLVVVSLYNLSGQELTILKNEFQLEGNYGLEFESGSFSPGMYMYDLKVNSELIETRRMVIVK